MKKSLASFEFLFWRQIERFARWRANAAAMRYMRSVTAAEAPHDDAN